MKRIHVIGLMAMSLLFFRLLASPDAPVDETGQIMADETWSKSFSSKLAAFSEATGSVIHFEFHAKSPSAEEDAQPGAYMRALSDRLGLAERGAVAVYFADENDWRLWLGNELAPAFVGRAGTAAEFTENGAMHEAKEAFFQKAFAHAAALHASAPPGAGAAGADFKFATVRLQAEALVTELQEKLVPKK